MNHPEVVGLIFVVAIFGLFVGISLVIGLIMNRNNTNDFSDVLDEELVKERCKADCEVIYELEHYTLKFELFGDLWYANIKTGDHISWIHELRGQTQFRKLLLETMLFLKVEPSNQLA